MVPCFVMNNMPRLICVHSGSGSNQIDRQMISHFLIGTKAELDLYGI